MNRIKLASFSESPNLSTVPQVIAGGKSGMPLPVAITPPEGAILYARVGKIVKP